MKSEKNTRYRNIAFVGSFLLLFMLFIFPLNSTSVYAAGSFIVTYPGSGAAGSQVQVDGHSFLAGATVTINFCGSSCTPLATSVSPIIVSTSGTFVAIIKVPSGIPLGLYTISATDGSNTATTSFSVTSVIAGTCCGGVSSSQRQVFYSNGFWWAFWQNSSTIYYSSSPDGTTWLTPAALTTTPSTDFTIWEAGNSLYYLIADNSQSYFTYGKGTLSGTGTVSSTAEAKHTTTNPVQSGGISIITDSAGNVWVALNTAATVSMGPGLTGQQAHLEVWLLNSATSSWTKVNDIAGPAPSCPYCQDTFYPNLVPLPADPSGNPQVGLLYEDSNGLPQILTANLGTSVVTWSTAVQPTTTSGFSTTVDLSALSIGDVIYTAGISGINVVFFTYTLGQTTSPVESTLSNTDPTQILGTSIEKGPYGSGSLAIFYGNGRSGFFVDSNDYGSSWSSPTIAFNFIMSLQGVSAAYASSPSSEFGALAVDYEGVNPASPDYYVVFGSFSLSSTLASTSTSVTCSPNVVPVNAPTTCTATVTGTTTTVPTGSVSFNAISGSGSFTTPICSTIANTLQCSSTYVPAPGSEGSQVIGAQYSGDSTYSVSSGTFSPLTVNKRSSSTSLSCPTTVQAGSSLTCQVTVTDSTPLGTSITPTGTVTFSSSLGVVISSCSLTAGTCSTPYSPTVTQTGSDTVTATYSGDFDHTASNSQANIGVTSPPPSAVQVSITLNQFVDSTSGPLGSAIGTSNYFTVSYTLGGKPQTALQVGGTLTIYTDPNTQVTISGSSSQSSLSEEWCLAADSSGNCLQTPISVGTTSVSETYTYFDLQAQLLAYEVTGGPVPPSAPYFEYDTAFPYTQGSSHADLVTLNSVPLESSSVAKIWVLAGTIETFEPNIASGSSLERWQASPICSQFFGPQVSCGNYVSHFQLGPFNQAPLVIVLNYYYQWEQFVSYKTSDGSAAVTPPTLTYFTAGVKSTIQLEENPTTTLQLWMDNGSTWSVPAAISGSSGEQWVCQSSCSGTVPYGNFFISPFYAHQYLVTFSGQLEYPAPSAADCQIPQYEGTVGLHGVYVECGPYPYSLAGTPYASGQAYFGAGVQTLVSSNCPGGTQTGVTWSTDTPSSITIATTNNPTYNCVNVYLTATGPGNAIITFTFQGHGSYITVICNGLNICETVVQSDPAYVLITGPGGGQVGCDSSGAMVDTLKFASVDSCSSAGTGEIHIPLPLSGTYTVSTSPIPGNPNPTYGVVVSMLELFTGTPVSQITLTGTAPSSQQFSVALNGQLSAVGGTSGVGVPEFGPIAGIGFLAIMGAFLPVLLFMRRRIYHR